MHVLAPRSPFVLPLKRYCKALKLLQNDSQLDDGDNQDLWQRLAAALRQTYADQIDIPWIPSHVDISLCETSHEEFLATWNNIADAQAVLANRHRGSDFERLLADAADYYKEWDSKVHILRDFYLKIAEQKIEPLEVIDLTDEPDIWIQKISDVPLGDALSVDWQHQLRLRSESLALPADFVSSLIQICIAEELVQHNFVAVSFLELVLWIVQILNAQFPVERTKDGQWICKTAQDLFLRPTLAFVAQKVRQGLTRGLKALGLTDIFVLV